MFRLSKKPKPMVLCILDGWGVAPDYIGNAITQANCENFNKLWFTYPHTILTASGMAVGMPENTVGTSEVGHMNLGAGHVVFQDVLKIDNAIVDGTFAENEAFSKTADHIKKYSSNVHLLGLVGSGVVHSSTQHLLALLDLLKEKGIKPENIKIHLITDGRDSPPSSARDYVGALLKDIDGMAQIATVSGRYYTMDRDNRWDRTEKAYIALLGNGLKRGTDPIKVIIDSYASGITDEFIEPTVIVDADGKPVGAIKPNDAAIFFNFRQDRARQITKAFVLPELKNLQTSSGEKVKAFERGPKIENLFFVTFTEYEKDLPVSAVAFASQRVAIPIARVFAEENDKQFHIAETEKYAHITYFFNGGQEAPFPGEDRLLINSKKVASYDMVPEMSAPEITKEAIKRINSRVYDFIVMNYANADMVGHTGNLEATKKAVEAIDFHLGVLVKSVLAIGGAIIVTADHGNAEIMRNPKTGEKDTAHNLSPVPCIIIAQDLQGKAEQLKKGILADVAPTILAMMNIPKPPAMSGRNLLE
ncbi:2,3-bisphosphoglycerate-independent phosphoglycerate mutase [Candidatus Curtissbacteria bacterium]|nr:2,3-bisphosphoglycerate-independent phosphoglycerate mutase [Candidatus Curtissbacteria bacterium]